MLATTTVVATWLVRLLMLPTRATGACVYEPRSFGPGLGTDTDTASRAVLESTTCPKGQRIESLWVYHGHWVDGIRLKCSDVPDDEFEVDDKYLIGQGDDSSYTPVCEQEGGSGLNNITAVFSSGNTNYLADMVVTCLNGDENMNGFGNNFNSSDGANATWCADGYYAAGFDYDIVESDDWSAPAILDLICYPNDCLDVEEDDVIIGIVNLVFGVVAALIFMLCCCWIVPRKRRWVEGGQVCCVDNRAIILEDCGKVIGVAGLWVALSALVTLFATFMGLVLGLASEKATPWLCGAGWILFISVVLTLGWHLVFSIAQVLDVGVQVDLPCKSDVAVQEESKSK